MNVEYKAVRELDRLIATKVMGLDGKCEDDGEGWCVVCQRETLRFRQMRWDQNPGLQEIRPRPTKDRCEGKPYSTDIATAWEVVDKLKADGWRWHMGGQHARSQKPWCGFNQGSEDRNFIVSADTAPLAICRAALKALKHKEDG